MADRVVITGMGVVAPNAIGLAAFEAAIKAGISGIRFDKQLEELKFSCQISGKPDLSDIDIAKYMNELEQRNFNSSGILYGLIAGIDAWKDANLPMADPEEAEWDYGTIFGTGTSGIEKFREAIYKIDAGDTRRLGSTAVLQTMNSGIAAYLSGKLGLGNQVSTNSSACCTGTESILLAYDRIRSGQASVMLAGSTSDSGPYIWGGFDAMRVCTFKHNQSPQEGSRPLSASASGFVPGSGAGALVLESLDSALRRGARIYAEIAGGHLNSGGQRRPGSMTAPNPEAVKRCIRKAIETSGIDASEIDTINGHLTATSMDSLEVRNWAEALGRSGTDFPLINSVKGMVGHCLSASGSIESVASVLQVSNDFIFPNMNSEDLHPDIAAVVDRNSVPLKTVYRPVNVLVKASFGFGDVNAVLILKKYAENGQTRTD